MRRVECFLIILALALIAVSAFAQNPVMPRPIIMPGDTWTYQFDGDTAAETVPLSITVLATTPTTYTYRSRNAQETLVSTASVDAVPYGGIEAQWPLTVGKRWTYSGTGGGVSVALTATVDAYERVTVPAGVFPAFRIRIQTCGVKAPTSACGTFRMWVSPTAKNAVKVAWGDDRGWETAHLRRGSAVLTSYTVTAP